PRASADSLFVLRHSHFHSSLSCSLTPLDPALSKDRTNDSNLSESTFACHPPRRLAGQEGIEPPTPGFGDRWMSWALRPIGLRLGLAPLRSRFDARSVPLAPNPLLSCLLPKTGRTGGNRTPN